MIAERTRRLGRVVAVAAAGLVMAGCGGKESLPPKGELRFNTQDFVIRVEPETKPTRALEPIYWRVTVHDVKTGLPMQGGEGRVFATNRDRKTVSNGLGETEQLGTYRTNLMFVTAGMWAMAIQFRRDSTKVLQKTPDWTQDILAAEEPGDFTPPATSRPPEPPPRASIDSTRKGP
ncbi:MAG: hypothetical protein P3B76_00185 [Gemmatimonadota bacterium]|jgi:hypothetical protein|nr:hypothetical protein [Gemmatimonadota bacterium]MDQ8166641.1 hypothetical protein [Gemmatimonadota bacterium]MDQ8171076.1 hypothetical protein [Gemmatimonadota bacterium]